MSWLMKKSFPRQQQIQKSFCLVSLGGLQVWGRISPGPQKWWLGDIQQDLGPGGGQQLPFTCHLHPTPSALRFARLQSPVAASRALQRGRAPRPSSPALTPASDPATCFTSKWRGLTKHGRLSCPSSTSATPSSFSLFPKSLKRVRGDVVTLESVYSLAGKGQMPCHSLRRVLGQTWLRRDQEHRWQCQSNCPKRCRGKVVMDSPVSRSKG